MAKTSLTKIIALTHFTSFGMGALSGLFSILVCEWTGVPPRSFLGVLIWGAIGIALLVWNARFIRDRSDEMRGYAEERGADPRCRGMEAEILPFSSLFGVIISIATLALVAGVYLFLISDAKATAVTVVASISLVMTSVSAVWHGRFVHRVEEVLNAKNGWRTFHRWSPKTFRDLL